MSNEALSRMIAALSGTPPAEAGKCSHGWCVHKNGKPNPARPLHSCPFKEEIHGDYETLCDCCDDCAHECAMDI